MMKRAILLTVVTLLLSQAGNLAQAQIRQGFNVPGIQWIPAFQQAADNAKIQHKPLFVYLHTEWSGLCRLLENNVLSDTHVQVLLNKYYVPVHLAADSKTNQWFRGLQYTYDDTHHVHRLAYELMQGKTEFPTIVILNPKGEILTPVIGRIPAARLRKILDYYAEDTYMTISWDEFDAKHHY